MRLVRMLGGSALLAWPSSDGACAARPAIFPLAIFQSAISRSAIARSTISSDRRGAGFSCHLAREPNRSRDRSAAPGGAETPRLERRSVGDNSLPAKTGGSVRSELHAPPATAAPRPRGETEFNRSRMPSAHRRPKKKPASATARKAAPPGAHPGQKSTPNASPKKVVVRNGGASETSQQLSPGLSEQQASSQRQTIDLLLVDTAANLKKLSGRPDHSQPG